MDNCYLINILIVARATEFIVLFNRHATVKDIKFYWLKIGSLIYLVV